jgi:hypothetical protein
MPGEWRRSILVAIFKNKGIRRVVLIIWNQTNEPYNESMERIIEHRLRGVTNDTKNQFDFMSRRSTNMGVIFLIRKLIERCREQQKDLHMVFIDLDYEKVPKNIMWWVLQKHRVSTKYITLIKDMYDNVMRWTL